MTTDSRYYCSNKFKFIKIDLESRATYTCHAARPHRIDFEWLENNPGQLFNTPINVYEREQMLRNERNDSCEQNCWPAEDRGAPSPRLINQGQFRTHTDPITHPEIIDITLNSDCNLTCSYCCKEFSTSWRNDILQNGNYNIESESDRYSQTRMDQVLSRVSQAERFGSSRTRKLLDEIRTSSQSAKTIIISGGEPFLSKYLVDVVKENHHVPEIKIFTGLGVDTKRFERITDILAECKNVILAVSADSTGTCYEFNRYGMAWSDFLHRVEILTRRQLKFEFSSVISNLTVSGFAEFYKQFRDRHIRIECVYNPNFLSPHILDTATKNQAMADIESIDYEHKQIIIDSMQSDPTAQQRVDVARFLHEFVARRPGLTLSALPKTFTDWIKHVV